MFSLVNFFADGRLLTLTENLGATIQNKDTDIIASGSAIFC
jgi:hypothetical protein